MGLRCLVPVSMPTRRSCFTLGMMIAIIFAVVSMPPRRSCFAMAPVLADALASRFNATTAFLLRFSTNSSKSG